MAEVQTNTHFFSSVQWGCRKRQTYCFRSFGLLVFLVLAKITSSSATSTTTTQSQCQCNPDNNSHIPSASNTKNANAIADLADAYDQAHSVFTGELSNVAIYSGDDNYVAITFKVLEEFKTITNNNGSDNNKNSTNTINNSDMFRTRRLRETRSHKRNLQDGGDVNVPSPSSSPTGSISEQDEDSEAEADVYKYKTVYVATGPQSCGNHNLLEVAAMGHTEGASWSHHTNNSDEYYNYDNAGVTYYYYMYYYDSQSGETEKKLTGVHTIIPSTPKFVVLTNTYVDYVDVDGQDADDSDTESGHEWVDDCSTYTQRTDGTDQSWPGCVWPVPVTGAECRALILLSHPELNVEIFLLTQYPPIITTPNWDSNRVQITVQGGDHDPGTALVAFLPRIG
jgi:hypothetical protein